MRIERIHVDGFGHFADREFGPFTEPITVIEGLNEAGKSTLLAFIRTVLFGWPHQKRAEHYPPLRGGRHGGHISLLTEDGARYTVGRWEDNRGAHLLVTLPDGRQISDAAELGRLLGHASPAMFEEVFAFDADALRSLSEEASSDIFAAGIGARALPGALAALEKRRAELFRKSGSKQKVAGLLRDLHNVRSELAEASGQAAEYGTLTRRAEELTAELEAAEAALDEAVTAERDAAQLLKGWEPWVRATEIESEIAQLPEVDGFPQDGVTRLEADEQRATEAEQRRQRAAASLEAWRERAAAANADAALLAEAPAVNDLKERLGAYRQSLADLPKRRLETETKRATLDDALRELGPGWDAKRITEFDTSVQVQHEIAGHARAIEEASSAEAAATTEEAHAAKTLADTEAQETRAKSALDALPSAATNRAALKAYRDDLRSCRSLDAEWRAAENQRKQLEWQAAALATAQAPVPQRRRLARWAATAALLLVALVAIIPAASGSTAGAAATVITEGMVLAAVVFVWRGRATSTPATERKHPIFAEITDARERETALLASLHQASQRLGIEPSTPGAFERFEAWLDETAEALTTRETAASALRAASEAVGRARQQHDQAVAELASSRHAQREAAARWDAWLAARGLPAELTPQFAGRLLDRVDHARTLVTDLEGPGGHIHRQDAIAADIAAYERDAAALCTRLGLTTVEGGAATVARVNTIAEKLEQASEASRERTRALERAADAERELEQCTSDAEQAAARLAQLLEAAGVPDAEAFRLRAAGVARRRELETELARYTTRLATLSGPGDALERFRTALGDTTQSELVAGAEAARARLADAQAHRDALRDEAARTSERLSRLIDGTQTSRLLARRESLKQELRSAARAWSELTIARAMLERARRRWEDERQPGVVRDASTSFATITGGRYGRIVPQIDSNVLRVEDATSGQQKDASKLSRGTLEQLYLALRFGLIRQFGERETRLPVVVDEVLINFDAGRGARVAEAFAELAKTNQVLVFTCHGWVSELFAATGVCAVTQLEALPAAAQPQLAPALFAAS